MSAHNNVAAEKIRAAEYALRFVEDGMVLGLGSGSTALQFIRLLGEKVREGLRVQGIPTSERSRQAALGLGIPVLGAGSVQQVDMTIDGADEIDHTLNLIKGGGGALLWEKVVAANSAQLVVIADSRKLVDQLGKFPLPVEVVRFGWEWTARRLQGLAGRAELRLNSKGEPFLTSEGHFIVDCEFGRIDRPVELSDRLLQIPGVVEHGLFLGMASTAVIARGEQVTLLKRTQETSVRLRPPTGSPCRQHDGSKRSHVD